MSPPAPLGTPADRLRATASQCKNRQADRYGVPIPPRSDPSQEPPGRSALRADVLGGSALRADRLRATASQCKNRQADRYGVPIPPRSDPSQEPPGRSALRADVLGGSALLPTDGRCIVMRRQPALTLGIHTRQAYAARPRGRASGLRSDLRVSEGQDARNAMCWMVNATCRLSACGAFARCSGGGVAPLLAPGY